MCERPLLPLAGSFKRMSWTFSEYNRLLEDLRRSGVNIYNPSQFDNDNISPFVVGLLEVQLQIVIHVGQIKGFAITSTQLTSQIAQNKINSVNP